jgi:hypothetical protein
MLLPLLPLFFELMLLEHGPKDTTLALTVTLYAMAIGLTSVNIAMFCGCIVVGLVSSVFFGVLSAQEGLRASHPILVGVDYAMWICLALVFFIHLIERYYRHIVECRKFFDFGV